MKKFGLTAIIAGALSAAVIGSAGLAQADDYGPGFSGPGNGFGDGNGWGYGNGFGYNRDSNNPWLNQLYPTVKVPHVDTSVRH
jgi:hypothetical protein